MWKVICTIFFLFQIADTALMDMVGDCLNSTVQVKNLNMQKMLGPWYIIEENYGSASSSCSKLEFKQEIDQFSIEQCTTDYNETLQCFDFANLTISDGISAQINRKFLIFSSKCYYFNFHVIITDYDTYAGIYICQSDELDFSTKSIMILSRTEVLDQQYIDKILSKFIKFEIPTRNLRINDQSGCRAAIIIQASATESNKISFDIIYFISLFIIMTLK